MSLVKIINLNFKYANTDFWSLRNINLEISEGEFIIITGQSGCGKTTLLRAMNGLIPHYHQGEYDGHVILDGKEVSKHKVYELAKIAGIVFQNPEDQIFAMTVEKEVAFGLENLGIERSEMRKIVDETLQQMRISHLRFRQPFFLSGGEQQKVIISSILALKPKLILLDEPLSSLDPMSAQALVEELHRLNRQYGKTIVIAEHRLDLLSKYANRMIVMDKGQIILDNRIEEVLAKIDLESLGINEPLFAKFARFLRAKYGLELGNCLSIEEVVRRFNHAKSH
ncbi:MAG TPA: ABC transporter ATP-binding protein [Geobacterales bacterium]|nr:ABC transporter ATP-binding protein [Geobacterales bacterium]